MGLTRRERIKRQRDREAIAGIGTEGLKVEVSKEFRCDQCDASVGTLYEFDGRMLCYNHIPGDWTHGINALRLFGRAASGKSEIVKRRKKMAAKAAAA
jgi:hypothetical protein